MWPILPFRFRICAYACVLILCINARESFGDAGYTVVLVEMGGCCQDTASPDAEEALAAELALIGASVIPAVGEAADELAQRLELERLAIAHHATAAIRIFRAGADGPIDAAFWIGASNSRRNQYRRIEASPASDPDPMVAAVRTVEAFRAGLQAFHTDSPPAAQPEKTASAKKVPDNRITIYGLGMALYGAMPLSPGGMGQRGALGIALSSEPFQWLDVSVTADGSFWGETLQTELVSSELTVLAFRGWLRYVLTVSNAVRLSVGPGGGALVGRAEGTAQAGDPLKTAWAASGYFGGAGRVTVFVTPMFTLFFEARVGALFPEAEVAHGTETAATFGRPMVELVLGGELRLFPRAR